MTADLLPTRPLAGAVEQVRDVDLDLLADDELRSGVEEVHVAIRKLEAVRARWAGALADRSRAAVQADGGGVLAVERAERQVRRELADQLNVSPSQAKQLTADRRRLQQMPAAEAAFDDGAISTEHLRMLDRTTRGMSPELRADLEPQLVEAARTQDPVVFGRTCRAALAQVAPQQAEAGLDQQYRQRSARITQRPDGMSHLSVDLAGVDAAFAHTTLDAFRTRDAEGVPRTAEQRTADAFTDLVKAAAGTLDDPNARHARPVFLIQLPAERLLEPGELRRLREGAGTETFTGPLPLAELTRLLGDAHIAGLLANANGLPLAVTEQHRAVPIGLWRLLVARDGGCIAQGCDAPPGWCQVAHLAEWQADGGRLAPATAGLLCTRDHRHFDAGRLAVSWDGGRPTVHPPGQPGERRGGRRGKVTPIQQPTAAGPESPDRSGASPPEEPDPPPGEPDQVCGTAEPGRVADPHHSPPAPPTLPGIASEPRGTYRVRPPTAA